ncbi:MAG: long-chain fatty acid--CoA ligase [Candidatus Lokiarchaeota archaeon]|nr:long-chain fatty acid--CoA ligase [Candidatus Lokiarchaeota archaeon]
MNETVDNPYASKFWVKNYDEGIPAEIDIPEKNLYELVDKAAENFGKRPAIYFLKQRMPYKKLKDNVDRLATALADLGVQKGDRIGLMMPNFPQYVIAFYGILRAGAIVSPCNTLYTEHELMYQLNDSAAEILIAHDAELDKINNIKDSTSLRHVIISNVFDFAPNANKNPPEIAGTMQLLNLLKKTKPNPPKFDTNAKEDIAVLQYTGGTTGLPKGAMLTHYNLLSAAIGIHVWGKPYSVPGKETVLTQLPLSHIYGTTVCLNNFVNVAGCVALNPDPRDQISFFEVIKETHPTHLPGVPRIYMQLLEREDFKDYVRRFKSLKLCESGAAPMPHEVMEEFEEVTGSKIIEGYGMSETSAAGISNPVDGVRKPNSVGLVVPNMEFKLVDVDDYTKIVPLGETGEIMLRGKCVMKGYWNKPAETAEQMKEGGWILTGDIARMDEDGYVFIVDRKKDMINVSGFKVYPQEVENLLIEHDAVDKAGVIGLPNPDNPGSDTVKAFIVLKTEYNESDELLMEIQEFCRKNLAPYKVPKKYEFRKELPETKLLKLSRKDLKDYEAFQRGEEV